MFFLRWSDPLGSTSVVIDKASSELVERATYQAFGAPRERLSAHTVALLP